MKALDGMLMPVQNMVMNTAQDPAYHSHVGSTTGTKGIDMLVLHAS
jgi:hypothetical protein